MKPTGVVRRLDPIGRITLPAGLRETLGISEGTALAVLADDDQIILKKHEACCTFCGSTATLTEYRGQYICEGCILEIIGRKIKK